MRLLVLNPNTSPSVTERLAAVATRAASPGTEIVAVTAPRGFPYLSSRAEAQIGGAIALEMLAEKGGDYDGAVIAAFGDPGLHAARDVVEVPVVGMSEAGMLAACLLGRRFSLVTFAPALASWYEDCVALHGLTGRCASIRHLDEAFRSIGEVQEEKAEQLVALACRTVEQDRPDVIVLAGAPLAGLAPLVADRIPVPLVDPIAASIRQLEMLVAMTPRLPEAGRHLRPAAKPNSGLPPALSRIMAGR
ncbi:aspartate/glutamate racemase family protein [Enterovirga rhinocerotis]|uniref:Asp/Glu/hydantoin racemase n=1 Tax=Enterovirga rhinocerotis TaxID=1339210 RepID=A0A4R7BW88_9HYPH|nr:aspartate/glutamate racemase family protein [Enterovirga rhinocerotis]TDR90130.1 Asp/Glu/hydantoin racemase [Enterovirga rhinocerotis]